MPDTTLPTWVNNETVLNAQNMNQIVDAIRYIDLKLSEVDLNTEALTWRPVND